MTNKNNLEIDKSACNVCPSCDGSDVVESIIEDQFEYGSGSEKVLLSAMVPVISCSECGEEFTDYRAEELRHEAVCTHLGLLSPREIKALRRSLNVTQEGLAHLTEIGIASIKRWETGEQLQSASMDRFLRLLREDRSAPTRLAAMKNPVRSRPLFRTSFSDSQRRAARTFILRPSQLQPEAA